MMIQIRPWKLFSLVPEKDTHSRLVHMKIPSRPLSQQTDYSPRLLELMAIIACIRITRAKRMFEFGTFLGNTTLHMALNSPADARVWTLDADDATLERIGLLEMYSWRNKFPLEFTGLDVARKIRVIRGDSHTFDVADSGLSGSIDLVFIDGDHSHLGVDSDTCSAGGLLSDNGCIVWHDYHSNPPCPGNDACLDELALRTDLFQVVDTSLVIYFRDAETVNRLKEI